MKRLFSYLISLAWLFTACNDNTPTTPFIELSQSNLEAWFDLSTYSVGVKTNCTWRATCDSDWIIIDSTEKPKSKSDLEFKVLRNDSSEERTAKILVEVVGHSDTFAELTISQSILLDDYLKLCYTSTTDSIITPLAEAFNTEIESNTYENGVGTIRFTSPLTQIGEMAFCELTTLKTITIPDSVTSIGGWAFWGCSELESATLSNRLQTIGDSAFSSCIGLQSITLPESLKTLGALVFYGCRNISAFYGKFATEDNRAIIVGNALQHYAPKSGRTYTVPSGVTTIESMAFYESSALREVSIPASVTAIGDYAFYYCENMETVYCEPTTPPTLGECVFDNNDGGVDRPIGCKILVPNASIEAYKSATNWKRYGSYIQGDDKL